jgi:hypothetical protein
MLVAGRVGGLLNYELFTQYQELAMTMFGGYMNYTWNRVTKKLSIVRKIPAYGHAYFNTNAISANGTAVGSVITITLGSPIQVSSGNSLYIANCPVSGYSGQYTVATVDSLGTTITVVATQELGATSVNGFNLSSTQMWSPEVDGLNNTESVLLWIYNYKPDSMLLSDPMVYPWLQEYALAFCKGILGQARGKFSTLAGPQGGTQLNGAALLAESQAEMQKLEEDLKNYVDGSNPLTWITG